MQSPGTSLAGTEAGPGRRTGLTPGSSGAGKPGWAGAAGGGWVPGTSARLAVLGEGKVRGGSRVFMETTGRRVGRRQFSLSPNPV